MKQFGVFLVAFFLLLFIAPGARAADSRVVLRVISGDTFIVDGGQAVRVLGVLAPTGEEFYAREARQTLTTLILGQEVELIFDSTNATTGNKDAGGRLLAYVYRSSDNLFVNSTLLRQGYGFYSPKNVQRQATQFITDERGARKARRGLWEKNDTSPAQRAEAIKSSYEEPAFEFKPEYKYPDLRVEILWAKKADPRVKIARTPEQAKFLELLFRDGKVNSGELPPLVRLRRNTAEALTKFYQENNIPLKVETAGENAEILRFVAAGMDQNDANKFIEQPLNRELFSGLEFNEVIFTDDGAFSFTYKVPQ